MITMGGYSLPVAHHPRDDRARSIDVVVQAARLRDGSRRITHITEVMGMEGDVIITQDLFVYDMLGEDAQRQPDRPPPLDRHRPAAVLGARALLRRGEAARRRARCRAKSPTSRRRPDGIAADDHADASRLFFLVAVAIGGVAWVFVYPILSGERQAEKRKDARGAHRSRCRTRAARDAPKSRREQVEETLKELESAAARAEAVRRCQTHRAGRADLVEAAIPHHQRACSASPRSCWSS